jgi:predicted cobalt transporter CbtA
MFIAMVAGLISGLLVGGFHNLFTVPVMERAIVLEEEREAAETGLVDAGNDEEPLVSLGVQRVGLVVGTGLYGLVLGLLFSGGYSLLRRVAPGWPSLAVAVVIGVLGFWAISMLPFIKYPLNPPGVGEESTLIQRQGYQTLFMILSVVGVTGLLLALHRVSSMAVQAEQRKRLYVAVLLGYAAFVLILVFATPGNPDPVPVPIDLLELFRTLTMIGQFLLWAFLAAGVALALMWYQRPARADQRSRESASQRIR